MRTRTSAPRAAVFAMLQIVPSAEAHAQRVPDAAQLMPAAAKVAVPGALENRGISFAPAEPAPARPSYALPADSASEAWKRRMRPYMIGGAVAGAAVGYALAPKSCDVGDNMFCGYAWVGYSWLGLGIGAWAGFLTGYLREPR